MKNLFIIPILGALVAASSIRADLIAYEGFDIIEGENALNGSTGTTSFGWTGAWGTALNDVASGLGYDSLQAVGGSARLDTANGGSFRNLATSFSTGTVWMSFIGIATNSASYAGVSLYNPFGNERMFVGDTGSGTNWGFQSTGLGLAQASNFATTNLTFLVLRIDFSAGVTNNENVYLWVNPSLAAAPDIGSASASQLGININPAGEAITRVRLQQGSGTDNAVLDELRIGWTWDDVSPGVVPEPSTALLGTMGLGLLALARRHKGRILG